MISIKEKNRRMCKALCFVLPLFFSHGAFGGQAEEALKETSVAKLKESFEVIKKSVESGFPGLKLIGIEKTSLEGIVQIEMTNNGVPEVAYAAEDGSHIFSGHLIQLSPEGPPLNITEVWKSEKRIGLLTGLKNQDLVVFSPKDEAKAVIYVFTDIDCGYCQLLHKEVPEMNALGIEVRYVAWPRAGVESESGEKLRSVWCAEDQNMAMTQAKNLVSLAKAADGCVTTLAEQFEVGIKAGVRGTPAIFLESGQEVGGYVKASELAQMLRLQ